MDVMFWKIRSCKHISVVVVLLVTLAASGCVVPIPHPPSEKQFTKAAEARLVVGTTTKSQVLELLGKPDFLERGRFSLYEARQDSGGLAFLFITAGGFLALDFSDATNYRILLEFDSNNVLKRYDIEALNVANRLIHSEVEPRNAAFEQKAIRQAFQTRKVLFEGQFFTSKNPISFSWVAFSKDGRLVVARDELVGFWLEYLDTGREVAPEALDSFQSRYQSLREAQRLSTNFAHLRHAALSSDGTKLASITGKRAVSVTDVATGAVTTSYKGHGYSSFWTLEGALCAAFHPKTSLIASGGEKGYVKIWDRDTGVEVLSFKAHDYAVTSLAYSPDGRWLVTADYPGETRFWDAMTGRGLGALPGKRPRVIPTGSEVPRPVLVKFSPDGRFVAVNTGMSVELWLVGTSESSAMLSTNLIDVILLPYGDAIVAGGSYALDISPDGRLVAATNGATVVYDISNSKKLWRVIPTEPFSIASYRKDLVYGLAFSPDGKSLATATSSGVYLWQ